jgi:predicted Zn-ribbon and HTH transcriptional regulator
MIQKCKRCGHEWNARTQSKPVQCPRCKSYKWEVARGDK